MWIGLVLSTLSVVLILCASAPARRVPTSLETPGQGYLVPGEGDADKFLADSDGSVILPARYSLLLDVPAFLKNSNADVLRLRVEHGSHLDGTSPLAGWQTSVEASLQLPGMEIHPEGNIFQRLEPGIPAGFQWQMKTVADSRREGTLWVYLHFTPPEGSQPVRILLLARPQSFQPWSFLGLPALAWNILGAFGLLAGCVVGLPVALPGILLRWQKASRVHNKLDK